MHMGVGSWMPENSKEKIKVGEVKQRQHVLSQLDMLGMFFSSQIILLPASINQTKCTHSHQNHANPKLGQSFKSSNSSPCFSFFFFFILIFLRNIAFCSAGLERGRISKVLYSSKTWGEMKSRKCFMLFVTHLNPGGYPKGYCFWIANLYFLCSIITGENRKRYMRLLWMRVWLRSSMFL